jgi:putative DNA primase/helicase
VSGVLLKKKVALLAVAALLIRHYPASGNRHEAALVLGGVLARGQTGSADEIKKFVSAVARCAGDEEAEERGNSAAGAVGLLTQEQPTPGLPRMREVWGNTIANWLELTGDIGDGDGEIDRLARLDLLAYERERKQAAQRLGIRESVLDKIVEQRRRESQQNGSDDFLAPVEAWPHSVDGNELLSDLCDVFERHVVLHWSAGLACALWTLHAHAFNAAAHSPILDISSPTKRCGKTQLLAAVSLLVPKPLSAANVTAATVFRAIDRWHPTLLIDEVDTFLADKSDLRGVLNSGHTKSSAYVLRCVGDDSVPQQFSTWCPKVFAHIGRVDPTLEDRSVRIILRRRIKTETIDRIPKGDPYADLRRKCARWAADKFKQLEEAEPRIPKALNDRAADNWCPLLAIAEACGWEEKAREAALHLSEIDDDETDAIMLLGDLADLFDREERENPSSVSMPSADIVRKLAEMEDRKWPEYRD